MVHASPEPNISVMYWMVVLFNYTQFCPDIDLFWLVKTNSCGRTYVHNDALLMKQDFNTIIHSINPITLIQRMVTVIHLATTLFDIPCPLIFSSPFHKCNLGYISLVCTNFLFLSTMGLWMLSLHSHTHSLLTQCTDDLQSETRHRNSASPS